MHRNLLLVCAVAILPAAAAGAAEPEQQGLPEQKRLTWALQGEARFRPEYRGDADLNREEDDDMRLGLMRLRIGLEVKFGDAYRLFVQAQDSRVAGEEGSTTTNEDNLDLHQGYLEIMPTKSRRFGLTLGRQELKYGDERMIGAFGWDNIGRSFDGAKARYQRGHFWIDGFVAEVSNRVVDGATSGSELYGSYAQYAPRAGVEYEGYLLSFQDSTRAAGESGSLDDSAIQALGARVKQQIGRFDGTAEAAVQTGSFRGDDMDAWAFAGQGGFTWGSMTKTRLFAGYDYATGDEDPADGEVNEFFNFFPTNHSHYGYADYEGWRNLRSPYGGASLTRGRHFVRAAFHRFLLEEEAGAWKNAGGAVLGFDPAGSSGVNVGKEVDLTYKLTLPESCWLEGGVSRFAPSRFARRTRGDDPSWWGYLMLTWRFAT